MIRTTHMTSKSARTLAGTVLLALAVLHSPAPRAEPGTTDSSVDAAPVAPAADNALLQGIPAEDLAVVRSGPALSTGQAGQFGADAAQGTADEDFFAEAPEWLRPALLVLGAILMFGLIAAGIALTFGALRKDTAKRKRRIRRRTRRGSSGASSPGNSRRP